MKAFVDTYATSSQGFLKQLDYIAVNNSLAVEAFCPSD
jgi:hypothetical protein